jgi:hypothetical protein
VSHRTQDHQGNLDDQEHNLRQAVEEQGGVVLYAAKHVGSGRDRSWLQEHANNSKQQGALLLAETTCRFARHLFYHSQDNPDQQANEADLDNLRRWTLEVPLMTHLHPDATPAEVRSYQRRRGQRSKGRGGRPRKSDSGPGHRKRRRQQFQGRVRELAGLGYSSRDIAGRISRESGGRITHTTILNWLRSVFSARE